MKKLTLMLTLLLAMAAVIPMAQAEDAIPTALAGAYFQELEAACAADDGALWGIPLYGPMLLIDPMTLQVVANEPDAEGLLTEQDGVYVGSFPPEKIVGNSTTEYGGKLWSMVTWPLPEDAETRTDLMVHELFHYHQFALGMVSETDGGYDNSYMDEMEARISIQLEWNALLAACEATGDARTAAIADALAIRGARQQAYDAAADEAKFVISEGLADYTAAMVCSDADALPALLAGRREAQAHRESYVRTFGYFSGLLYGCLLDEALPGWKADVAYNTDLGLLLMDASGIDTLSDVTDALLKTYGYDDIQPVEAAMQAEKAETLKTLTALFVEGPTVTIPLAKIEIGYNPSMVQPLAGHGTVYGAVTIKDSWGTLEAEAPGALLRDDWSAILVPAVDVAEEGGVVTGDGWRMALEGGAYLAEEDGGYVVVVPDT